MSEQDSVLQQVGAARRGVQQANAQIEAARESVQEILALASSRHHALEERFNALNGLIESESARAIEATQEVTTTVTEVDHWVKAEIQERSGAMDQLRSLLAQSAEGSGGAATFIGQRRGTVEGQRSSVTELYERLSGAVTEGAERHAQETVRLQGLAQGWGGRVDSDTESHLSNMRTGLDGRLADARASFSEGLAQSVTRWTESSTQRGETLRERASQALSDLAREQESTTEELKQKAEQVRQTLSTLANLMSGSATIMIQGTDQATEMMKATHIGVRTIIGLMQNLKEIFDEIESAWHS